MDFKAEWSLFLFTEVSVDVNISTSILVSLQVSLNLDVLLLLCWRTERVVLSQQHVSWRHWDTVPLGSGWRLDLSDPRSESSSALCCVLWLRLTFFKGVCQLHFLHSVEWRGACRLRSSGLATGIQVFEMSPLMLADIYITACALGMCICLVFIYN